LHGWLISPPNFNALLEKRTLRVIGKGGKERLVPMNEDLFECIKQELASRPDREATAAIR
jgi:site-specific recombinase XerD